LYVDGAPSSPIGNRLLITVLSIGAFTTALNVTLLSPLLKRIAEDFNVSDSTAGQLATLTAGSSAITALLAAPWMDRYSRRAWLRFEGALLAAGSLISAVAPSFPLMFAGRAIAGIGGAIIFANCLAAAAEHFSDAHQRNRVIGLVSTSATLGAVIGLPLLTVISEAAGWRWAVGMMVPLAAIVFLGAGRLRPAPAAGGVVVWEGWFSRYRLVLANRETMALLGALVALFIVWFGWLIYFGAYAETVFAVSASLLSLAFLAGGLTEIVASNLLPILIRRRSPRKIAVAATIVLAVNLLAVGVVFTARWTIVPFIMIASAACIIGFLAISILLLDSLPSARGAVMSLQSAGLEFGGAAGVALTGAAIALLDDYETSFRLLALVLPLVLICLFRSLRLPRREGPAAMAAAETGSLGVSDVT
jgi:predicted MFS family arabinose efflux permease